MPAEDRPDRIHRPWVIPVDEKLSAYQALCDCDFTTLILQSPGTRQIMAHDPAYGSMLAEMKQDVLALDRAVLSGHSFGIHAAGILATDLIRRMALPKSRPEVPPKSASEAKVHATKLFAAKKFAHAADMYNRAIALLDLRALVAVTVTVRSSAASREDSLGPVRLVASASARGEQQVCDEQIAPTLHCNLAVCRSKQHRWAEVVAACDEALRLKPDYEKAMMRRATANRMLRRWEEATADAEAAKVLACAPGLGEALSAEVVKQAEALLADVHECVRVQKREAERQAREEGGTPLLDGEPIYGEHFDHILKRELLRRLPEPYVLIDEPSTNEVGMCKVVDDSNDAPPNELGTSVANSMDFTVEASVRSRNAKRYLYYSIDVTVPWRGLLYERGTTPHDHHDGFRGVVRLYNIHHHTDRDEWKACLMERPYDGELPTHTPGGCPIEPLTPLNPDGTMMSTNQQIDFWMKRKLPKKQERLLNTYGARLPRDLFIKVEEAIEGLRQWLGEYRTIPNAL